MSQNIRHKQSGVQVDWSGRVLDNVIFVHGVALHMEHVNINMLCLPLVFFLFIFSVSDRQLPSDKLIN